MLVRSWNVFHGRTDPPGRHAYLEEAIGLAILGDPDLVCLQEVPVWSLGRLEAWSGMAAFTARTRHRLGRLGRWPTDLHHGTLRSSLTGQANAVLVSRRHAVVGQRTRDLNDHLFVAREAHRLGFGFRMGLAWTSERRVCQVLRIRPASGGSIVLLHLHLTHVPGQRFGEVELRRAVAFGTALASAAEPFVVAGDLNLTATAPAVEELIEAGFSAAGPGIDHVLVKGARASKLHVWPEERRRENGRLLSDHAPVELTIG